MFSYSQPLSADLKIRSHSFEYRAFTLYQYNTFKPCLVVLHLNTLLHGRQVVIPQVSSLCSPPFYAFRRARL